MLSTDVFDLPVSLLERIVDVDYCNQLGNSNWHIKFMESLKEDVKANGLNNPLILEYKDHTLVLQDGYHRYVAMTGCGWMYFPCEFHVVTEPHTKQGIDVSDIIGELLRNYTHGIAGNRQYRPTARKTQDLVDHV